MRVRILFFGVLKDLAGRPSEEADFPEGADLRAVFDTVAARCPPLREMARSIVVARNREFADLSTRIEDGDELAFLPPVSGGATDCPPDPGHYFALTNHPIDTRPIIARLLTGAEGAVVTFEGTARNNTNGRATLCLDYEGYEAMAVETMAKIGLEIAASIVEFFHEQKNINVMKKFNKACIVPQNKEIADNAPLQGKSFVFTGTMESMGRNDAKTLVENLGGTIHSNVTQKTTYIVTGSEPGSKLDKAKSSGIKILSEEEFLKLIGR